MDGRNCSLGPIGLVVVFACLGALTGCSQAPAAEVSSATATAFRSLMAAPIELDIAEGYLVDECMSRLGHLSPPSGGGSVIPDTEYGVLAGVLVGPEEQHAAAGYSSTYVDAMSPLERALQHMAEPEREAYLMDLYGQDANQVTYTGLDGNWTVGVPGDGCLAEARAHIYGSVIDAAKVHEFPNELSLGIGSAREAVLTAVAESIPAYTTCMSTRGHALTGLWASRLAEERFGRYRTEGTPPGIEEEALIRDDHQCQKQTGLMHVIDSAILDAAASWLVTHESSILERQGLMKAATERANAVING